MSASGAMQRRLDRLAKRLPPVPMCRVCMYPRPESRGYIVTTHKEPLEKCPGCGRALDNQGVPMHQPYKRLILMRGEGKFTRDSVLPQKQ